MAEVNGLSFVNNVDFNLPNQNLDALMELNKVYQDRWAANKSNIQQTDSFLNKAKEMDINGSNKVHLQNGVDNFTKSISSYVDEGDYEHASKSVDEATRNLTNDIAFNQSVTDYKTYQEWATTVKTSQQDLLKAGKGAWTDQEQAMYRNHYRQSYGGVKKNEDGTVTGGFSGGDMGEKIDIAGTFDEWVKDTHKEVTSRAVTVAKNGVDTIYGIQTVKANNTKAIYEYAMERSKSDPRIAKFFETQSVINSQKDIVNLASEVVKTGGSTIYNEIYKKDLKELTNLAKNDTSGIYTKRLADMKASFNDGATYGLANALEDKLAEAGIDIKFPNQKVFAATFTTATRLLEAYQASDDKTAFAKLNGEGLKTAMTIKNVLANLGANNLISNAALEGAVKYGMGETLLTSLSTSTDHMKLKAYEKKLKEESTMFATNVPAKVDILNSFTDDTHGYKNFTDVIIKATHGFRTAEADLNNTKVELSRKHYKFDPTTGKMIGRHDSKGAEIPISEFDRDSYNAKLSNYSRTQKSYKYWDRIKNDFKYKLDSSVTPEDNKKYEAYKVSTFQNILNDDGIVMTAIKNILKPTGIISDNGRMPIKDAFLNNIPTFSNKPKPSDLTDLHSKLTAKVKRGEMTPESAVAIINNTWKKFGNTKDLISSNVFTPKTDYFSKNTKETYAKYANGHFLKSFSSDEILFNFAANKEGSENNPDLAVINAMNGFLNLHDLNSSTVISQNNGQTYAGKSGKNGIQSELDADYDRLQAVGYGYDPIKHQNYAIVQALDKDGKTIASKSASSTWGVDNIVPAKFRVYDNSLSEHFNKLDDVLSHSNNPKNVGFAQTTSMAKALSTVIDLDAISDAYTGYESRAILDHKGTTRYYVNKVESALNKNNPAEGGMYMQLEDANHKIIAKAANYSGLIKELHNRVKIDTNSK